LLDRVALAGNVDLGTQRDETITFTLDGEAVTAR
jgi:hypothetical protein